MIKKFLLYILLAAGTFTASAQCNNNPWWNNFNDPTLDSLIYLGQNNNLNLAQALRNVEMARQTIRETKSGYYPQFSLGVGWERAKTSSLTSKVRAMGMTESFFSLGVNMSWEVDLFGRITAKVKEAKGAFNASREDYEWMCVTISAEIATYYMQLRTLQHEFVVTEQHIEQQEKVLKITEARYETGLSSKLDVAQAKTVYYSTKATLCNLQTQINTNINAIAILTAVFPQEMQKLLSPIGPMPETSWTGEIEINLDLLRNRPDVKEAEYMVEEYAAALGVEKKQWLPSLSITGSIGTEAWYLKDLFKHDSFTYSIAPQLSWTIFDGLAREASIASAKEQLMSAVDNYNLTYLTAVQEVDNALSEYTQAVKYEQEIAVVLENAQLAYNLALDRYKHGLDAFINVSDALITLLEYANEIVIARGNVLTSLVTLQKSLVL